MDKLSLDAIRSIYLCDSHESEAEKLLGISLRDLYEMDADQDGYVGFDEYLFSEKLLRPYLNINFLRVQFVELSENINSITRAAANWNNYELKAGALVLNIYISETAHLFHVVDNLSEWDVFCHKQYKEYFERHNGGLSKRDIALLRRHKAIRQKFGWGRGLEQVFYTPLDIDAALSSSTAVKYLTNHEILLERKILMHFAERIYDLMEKERPALACFLRKLIMNRQDIAKHVAIMSRFAGGVPSPIPVYPIANPDEENMGGGYNGGRLTVEVARSAEVYSSFVHEMFHAFLELKNGMINRAALNLQDNRLGNKAETLHEGLAYAYASSADELWEGTEYRINNDLYKDRILQFNAYGLAIFSKLKSALAKGTLLDNFLPVAVKSWAEVPKLLDEMRQCKNGASCRQLRERLGISP